MLLLVPSSDLLVLVVLLQSTASLRADLKHGPTRIQTLCGSETCFRTGDTMPGSLLITTTPKSSRLLAKGPLIAYYHLRIVSSQSCVRIASS